MGMTLLYIVLFCSPVLLMICIARYLMLNKTKSEKFDNQLAKTEKANKKIIPNGEKSRTLEEEHIDFVNKALFVFKKNSFSGYLFNIPEKAV